LDRDRSPRDEPLSVVVLAGGQGRRFGQDKTGIRLAGETLLERSLRRMAPLSDDLIVAGGNAAGSEAPDVRWAPDLAPYEGVLAGIAGGLLACRYPWAFVVASDMPFVSLALVRYMAALRARHDAVVPRLEVGLEPLHALYSQSCLPALREALSAGRRRAISFYESLCIRYVEPREIAPYDPDGRSFFNINTPDDLAQAERWLASG